MPSLQPEHLRSVLRGISRKISTGSGATVRDFLMVWLGLHGLRISEVCNLLVGDFDRKKETLYVRTLKGGPPRAIPIDRRTAEHLKKWTLARPADDYLFRTRSGRRVDPRNLRRRFTRFARKESGANYRFHDLRHTACAQVFQKTNGNLIAAGFALRHANINNTVHYLTSSAGENLREWFTYDFGAEDHEQEEPSPHEAMRKPDLHE